MTEKVFCDNCTDKGHCPEYKAGAVCVNDRTGRKDNNMKYEVASVSKDGTLCRGGIATDKSHAQRWANENSRMYPDEKFIVVEYEAETV